MPSIHFIITKYILTGIFLVAMVTGFVIDKFTRQQFNSHFNKTLEHKAWTLATLTDQKYGNVEFDFADEMMPEFGDIENPEFFQLWLGNGEMLERSHSLLENDLPFLNVILGDTVFQDVELPDGQPGRLVAIHFTPQLDDDEEENQVIENLTQVVESHLSQTVTLILAKNRTGLIQHLLINRVVIVISFISMLLLSYLIIHYATKKGLSPLTALSSQVQNIDDQSLDTEIDTHKMFSELTAITLQLNHLFSRLNAAFKREKRFSSNVSHELRTPIAELLILSDVAKSCVDNPDMTKQFFNDTKDIALNMNQIVETMLTLAQSETTKVTKKLTVFNLNECIKSSIKRVEFINKNKLKIEWNCLTSNSIQVYSDWEKFAQILSNIIINAYKYGGNGRRIYISSTQKGQFLSLSISNYSKDLDVVDLQHLTEYFWRKDEARTGGKNTGLGLTLVEMLCQVLNILLTFELNEEQFFTVTLNNISSLQYNID